MAIVVDIVGLFLLTELSSAENIYCLRIVWNDDQTMSESNLT